MAQREALVGLGSVAAAEHFRHSLAVRGERDVRVDRGGRAHVIISERRAQGDARVAVFSLDHLFDFTDRGLLASVDAAHVRALAADDD